MHFGGEGVGPSDLLKAGGKIAVEPAQQVRGKLQGGQGFKEGEMGSRIKKTVQIDLFCQGHHARIVSQ